MIVKILVIGIFGVLAVMILTAMLHLIAPYVAAMIVLILIAAFAQKYLPEQEKDPEE